MKRMPAGGHKNAVCVNQKSRSVSRLFCKLCHECIPLSPVNYNAPTNAGQSYIPLLEIPQNTYHRYPLRWQPFESQPSEFKFKKFQLQSPPSLSLSLSLSRTNIHTHVRARVRMRTQIECVKVKIVKLLKLRPKRLVQWQSRVGIPLGIPELRAQKMVSFEFQGFQRNQTYSNHDTEIARQASAYKI